MQNLHWAFCPGHFAVVTLLKDLHQQMDLQAKSLLSTLIVSQSSCETQRHFLLLVQQQAVTKPRNQLKLLCDQRDGFLVAVS